MKHHCHAHKCKTLVPLEEWFVYQIGGAERNAYHFIITWGMDDSAAESQLREGEFIDCVVTLSGVLKGSVEIIPKAD